MKKLFYSLFTIAMLSLTSCSVTMPIAATSNPMGSKTGKATGTCFLYQLCFGADASVQSAAKNGGITKISTVDLKTTNLFGIIVTYTCIVTGE
jgi:hypothetical protein